MGRLITFLLVVASAVGASTQPSSIRGRVVDDETGQPLRNAAVRTADSDAVATDASGRFALPATSSTILSASKAGYADSSVQAVDGVELRLPHGRVITGRVFDDFGSPMALITIVAQRITGREPRTAATVAHVESDDTGAYRLFGLPAGDYVVAAAGTRVFNGAGTTPMPRPIVDDRLHNFYPHAATLDAAAVLRVAAGAELAGIDLTIHSAGVPLLPPEPPRQNGAAGAVRGRVVTADGVPVRRARVELASSARLFSPTTVQTDDDGRYEFAGVPAGNYLVTAIDTSFTVTRYGQRRPGDRGDDVRVGGGSVVGGIDIVIPRGCVIGGRIVDDFGDPIANANVRVEQIRWRDGRMRLVRVTGVAGQQTNDLGRFRVFGLPPGRYVVHAVLGEDVQGWAVNDLPGFQKTFYPGTPQPADAQLVDLSAGGDALTVDFALVHGRPARISGRAVGADGLPLEGLVDVAPSARSGALVPNEFPKRVRTDNGIFAFDGLPPGEYVVQAATASRSRSNEGEFGAAFVTLTGTDVDNLVVRASAGSTVKGRVTFDDAAPSSVDGFEITTTAADLDLASLADNPLARAEPDADWAFEIAGLSGPRRITVRTPDGWMLKEVLADGIDVTDAALLFGSKDQSLADVEVQLTHAVTELRVAVNDSSGAPARSAGVLVFSEDRARWYTRSRFLGGGPASGGVATLRALPPGEYYVAAIDARPASDPQGESTAADFLETLIPAAARVRIEAGQRATISVRAR